MFPSTPHEDFTYLPALSSPRSADSPHDSFPSSILNTPYEEDFEYDDEILENHSDEDSSDFTHWKSALRDDFESWLDALDEIPIDLSEEPEPDENPDLTTLFGDISSIALENRKSNRRTAEAFSQWNSVLTGFQDELKRLRERERSLLDNQTLPDPLPTSIAAFLVDFHDRLTRITLAQSKIPDIKIGIFGNDSPWKTAWKNQSSALDITLSHLQTLLKEQGFERIESLGKTLDPTRMAVVEARHVPDQPPHIVIAELAPGWILGSRVLRTAQVIVSTPSPII